MSWGGREGWDVDGLDKAAPPDQDTARCMIVTNLLSHKVWYGEAGISCQLKNKNKSNVPFLVFIFFYIGDRTL